MAMLGHSHVFGPPSVASSLALLNGHLSSVLGWVLIV